MLSKAEYRTYFAECMNYVKMKNVLHDMGMTPTNFYRFMKGSNWDYMMSVEMLDRIYRQVSLTLQNLT